MCTAIETVWLSLFPDKPISRKEVLTGKFTSWDDYLQHLFLIPIIVSHVYLNLYLVGREWKVLQSWSLK